MIDKLCFVLKVLKNEKKRAIPFRLLGLFFYIFSSKFNAILYGWNKSSIGNGARIIGTKFILIKSDIKIGRMSWIEAIGNYGTDSFSPQIIFGKNFIASEYLHISSINKIEIGHDCLFGSNVYISDHNHGAYQGFSQSKPDAPPISRKLFSLGRVKIGNNVWIGENVVIIGPAVIGDGAVIGANSVVLGDIPNNSISVGAPAKVIKEFDIKSEGWVRIRATMCNGNN